MGAAMANLDTLRAISEAHVSVSRANPDALPASELRFVLEYTEPPDIGTERVRIEQTLGLQNFEFRALFQAPDPDLSRFTVLSIVSVERTLPPEDLFGIAYDIGRKLSLVSVEPDIGTAAFADPEAPGANGPRAEGADLFAAMCWVNADPPQEKRWALDNVRASAAWTQFGKKGAGILIGHVDTGVADHLELDKAALDFTRSADILEGDSDPTDPLDPTTANPGHGLSTASVIVGGEAGQIAGIAPEAKLVPIRCINDVKVFDAAPIAAGIDHARRVGCHIVTMSLGGIGSRAMRKSIEKAIDADLIVLAAAGNCISFVVWPARYDSVIAVAGTNAANRPWKGSCYGNDVDIAAPAEFVWRAERRAHESPPDVVSPGQGTSYAVAIVAGIAALWLSHHGRDMIIAEARRRGVSVQRLFRSALQATSTQPAEWDADNFGPGIVDAARLLALSPGDIPLPQPEATARIPEDDARALLAEMAGTHLSDLAGFDWPRYGLEVANALLTNIQRGQRKGVLRSERTPSCTISSELQDAAIRTNLKPLADFVLSSRARHTLTATPRSADDSEWDGLSIITRSKTSSLESAASLDIRAEGLALHNLQIRDEVDRLEKAIAYHAPANDDPDLVTLRREVVERSEQVLHRLSKQQVPVPTRGRDRLAFEALVALHGRPALRVRDGWLDTEAPEVEPWLGILEMTRNDISAVLPSIGRIDLDGQHVGTGFIIAPGLAMTNRHVIEALAYPVPSRSKPEHWILRTADITINFSDNAEDPGMYFRVKSVAFSGADPILDTVNFGHLDMAILEVESTNEQGTPLPPPLPFNANGNQIQRAKQLFAVGFPALPRVPDADFEGVSRLKIVEQLRRIFGLNYGIKYFSPGVVRNTVGHHEQDRNNWIFDHDATTLGGNSGSSTFSLQTSVAVTGLHFAGDWMRANHAHSVVMVRERGAMKHPAFADIRWI